MTVTEFLQTAPLYRKVRFGDPLLLSEFLDARPQLACPSCGGERPFHCISVNSAPPSRRAVTSISSIPGPPPEVVAGKVHCLKYRCLGCEGYEASFLIAGTEDNRVAKAGRWPAPAIGIARELEAALGPEAPYFQKGRMLEENGYGIGAYAYYRRVIENKIGSLLEEVANVLPPGRREYREALESVRASHVAEEKIKIVKDLLPESLRPAGRNPLSLIYDVLSEGLHYESDDQCLALATSLRVALTTLVAEVARHREVQKDFTKALDKLQNRPKPEPGKEQQAKETDKGEKASVSPGKRSRGGKGA